MTITVCATEEETAALLSTVLDSDHTAASLLARAIHQDPATTDASTDGLTVPLRPSELGIWIDPIGERFYVFCSGVVCFSESRAEDFTGVVFNLDATSQYIEGREEVLAEGHLSPSGLHCALVLIGVYLRNTGEPVMGVINQPFNYKDPTDGRYVFKKSKKKIVLVFTHMYILYI